MLAIKENDLHAVQVLLEKGLSPLQSNKHRWNSVHFALKVPKVSIIKLLLEGHETRHYNGFGLKAWVPDAWRALDQRTIEGFSGLHIAAANPEIGVLKYLLQFYVSRSSWASQPDTPPAIRMPFATLEELLNSECNKGMTPLLTAGNHQLYSHATSLIEVGSNMYATNRKLQNILHLASIQGALPFVRKLVYLDSDKNQLRAQKDVKNRTPELFCTNLRASEWFSHIWDYATHGNVALIKKSIGQGTWGVNQQTPVDKKSPLHVVVASQKLQAGQLLLQLGGNASLESTEGLTPIDLVMKMPNSPEKEEWMLLFGLIQPESPEATPPKCEVRDWTHNPQTRYFGIWTSISMKINEKCSSVFELFKVLGKDLNDTISPKEFNAVLQWLGVPLPKSEVKKLLQALDTDGNGQIDYSEILEAITNGLTIPKA